MIHIISYDQESGREGVELIAQLFEQGWKYLIPLKHTKFECGHGLYHAVFYKP